MPIRIDLMGKKFGRLFVIKQVYNTKRIRWECNCDCGRRTQVNTKELRNGDTKSCGCLRKELMKNNSKNHFRKGIPIKQQLSSFAYQKLRKAKKNNKNALGKRWELSEKTKSKMKKPKSEEHKKKISESGKREKNSNWLGGISFEPYSFNWTKALKRSIRERDKYICQICGKKWKKGTKQFDVHHINYNKKNCNPNNLITLCRKCHLKTGHNRNKWIKYFRLV